MSDAKLVDCPKCEKPTLRKQLTAAAFKLKGTGWYETDFKNSGAKPGEPSGGPNKKAKTGSGNSTAAGGAKSASGSPAGANNKPAKAANAAAVSD